jgi:hypothetical protein
MAVTTIVNLAHLITCRYFYVKFKTSGPTPYQLDFIHIRLSTQLHPKMTVRKKFKERKIRKPKSSRKREATNSTFYFDEHMMPSMPRNSVQIGKLPW